MNATKNRIKEVEERAKKELAEHTIEKLWSAVQADGFTVGAWLCSKPGTSVYAFTIYSVAGRLIIAGDMGACVWERERDMIRWARNSIRDVGYFESKVPREIQTKVFDVGKVRELIAETDRSVLENDMSEVFVKSWIGEHRAELLRMLDAGESESEFYRYVHDNRIHDEPNFDNYTHQFLWLREAVAWFLDHYQGE